MKKLFATVAIVILCAMLLMPITAFANSAQREFQGVTSTGAMVTGVDCPVAVTSERLTFNIGSFPSVSFDSYDWASYNTNVTAEYTFYNPADYEVNMQLVFPLGRLPYWIGDDFADQDKYSVYVNGDKVERGLRATYSGYSTSFDLPRDLPRIRDEREPIATMPDNLPVYKYSVQSKFVHNYTSYKTVARYVIENLAIVVLNDVFYQNIYNGDNCCNIYGDNAIVMYSIGRQLPDSFFRPTYYVETSEYSRKSSNIEYEVQEVSGITTYQLVEELTFEDLIFINYDEQSGIPRDDYYNAMTDAIHRFEFINSVCDTRRFDLTDQLMLWYSYDVGIPAGQSVTNTVVAPLYPTVDEYYTPTKYSYEYLLSPAASWASFADLDVTVNTSVYMLDSSLQGFVKTSNGYTAHFDTLPEGELTFALCASGKPKYNDNYGSLATFMWILLGIIIFLGIVIAVDLLAAAIVVPIAVTKSRRKRAIRQQSTADSTACVVRQADNSAKACLPESTANAVEAEKSNEEANETTDEKSIK